ncbi:MAG: hypothetical protein J6B64_01310 [Bacilli bacterium]|nr:hypothetical protein [Bacilli bacterium]MBP3635138.1 hypothetical protein [Bacilli bacterium]
MEGLLRKLSIWICSGIYKLIPKIYDIFFTLSNGNNILENDMIEQLSANVYVLVSVVMLFAFSANLLAAIVNPDLLSDKKKGVGAMFKRFFMGLILMVIVPFLFKYAYSIQNQVMTNNLIEKIVVGINFSEGNNGGQVIAGTLISSVIRPASDEIAVSDNKINEYYTKMVAKDIGYISQFADYINEPPAEGGAHEYAFEFEQLIALIAGIAMCYILLLFSIDMAVRIFKLLFLELTAPISIIAYMALGDDYLKKWSTEVGKTYAQVFVKIVCMAFYLFLISHLNNFLDTLAGTDNFFLKVLLVVGMLIFAKQIPDLIGKVFGIDFKLKGGIGGRLGEMAAVGGIAKKAWDGLKNTAKNVATLGATGLAAATGYGLYKGANALSGGKVQKLKDNIKNSSPYQTMRTTASAIGSGVKAGGGIKGTKAMLKDYKESDYSKQRKIDKDNNALDRIRADAHMSAAGRAIDKNGNILNADISGLKNMNANYDNFIDSINKSNLNSKTKKALINKVKEDKKNAQMQEMKKLNTDIISDLSTLSSNTTGSTQIAIDNLKSDYATSKISFGELTSKLQAMVNSGQISKGAAGSIIAKANKYESMVVNADDDLAKALGDSVTFQKDSNGNIVKDVNGLNIVGKINNKNISARASDQQKIADAAKSTYEANTATLNEESKTIASAYDSESSNMASEQTRIISGVTKNNKIDEPPIAQQTAYTKGELHSQRQQYYDDLFTSQTGQDYLNQNEAMDPDYGGVQTRPYNGTYQTSSQTNTSSGSIYMNPETETVLNGLNGPSMQQTSDNIQSAQNSNNVGGGTTIINNYHQSDNSNNSDMSGYFDGLSKDIKDASKSTNDILNNQLEAQKSILDENKTQNQNLRNIKSGITDVNNNITKVNENIKKIDEGVGSVSDRLKKENSDEE